MDFQWAFFIKLNKFHSTLRLLSFFWKKKTTKMNVDFLKYYFYIYVMIIGYYPFLLMWSFLSFFKLAILKFLGQIQLGHNVFFLIHWRIWFVNILFRLLASTYKWDWFIICLSYNLSEFDTKEYYIRILWCRFYKIKIVSSLKIRWNSV